MISALAGIGAVVGGALAVLVHFLSWQVARGEQGVQGYASLDHLSVLLRPTQPGWSPMLVLYIGVGLLAGALVGWTIWSLGHEVRLVRRRLAGPRETML